VRVAKKSGPAQKPFAFECSTAVFPPDELAALSEHGNRLEALVAGAVQPASPEDKHFLLVDREEAEPKNVVERAWLRLKGRREFERAERERSPLAPTPNYGMVEFDADRCWW